MKKKSTHKKNLRKPLNKKTVEKEDDGQLHPFISDKPIKDGRSDFIFWKEKLKRKGE